MIYGGIMISQCFPTSRNTDGETLPAGRYTMETCGFTQIQMVDILGDAERRAFGEMARTNNAHITYCIARLLNENKLFLGDLNPVKRERAIELVKSQYAKAHEAGAEAITLISGPQPESEADRQEALRLLADSLTQIAAYGRSTAPEISLRIEPLDVYAHKKNVLGTTEEAISLCSAVKKSGEHVGLCFDTAHAILNGEDIVAAVESAGELIEEFHLCNACTQREHPLFGDRHIAPGAPGAFDIPDYQRFIETVSRCCPNARVFTEYFCPADMDGKEMIAHHSRILEASGVTMRR